MKIQENYSLAQETTFLCGGKARYFCAPQNFAQFETLLKLHKGKLFILGAGSKTLCSDAGFDGLVLSTKKLTKIEKEGKLVVCECGVKFQALADFCQQNGLGGLEWSAGIPASVGGAVVMNAGAFGHEFGECVEKVEIFEHGQKKILEKNQIEFSYRNSSLKGKCVFRVWLNLQKAEGVKEAYLAYFQKKFTNQPQNFGSAGSVFKRQKDVIPAKIIDKLGLKGAKIGGAEVSCQHSGFIVNTGSATATDVQNLVEFVRQKVFEREGVVLENELIILE